MTRSTKARVAGVVIASMRLVVALPRQIGALMPAPLMAMVWLPMAAFEIPLGIWFIVKGVRST